MMGEHICGKSSSDGTLSTIPHRPRQQASRTHLTASAAPPMPAAPANFDQFMPYNKSKTLNDKLGRAAPPKVDTTAASTWTAHPTLCVLETEADLSQKTDRGFYRNGQLTPVSNSSGSRSVSPKTPVGRPGAGRADDYFAPKIANEYDSTPPQQSRRPGGYGGFSDNDGFDMEMYPATSPKKQPPSLLSRMNSLAPGPFDIKQRPKARNAFPSKGSDVNSSDDDRSDSNRGRYGGDRFGTSSSTRSNGGAPSRLGKKDGYGGFGSRRDPDDFEPEPFGTSNRAGTFPRQSEAAEPPLRTPSAPGPRPDRFRRPSDEPSMLPPRTPRSRRPSMGPDTSRPPPPRTSVVRPRTSGRDAPSINLAAEFGIGNPYHGANDSMSSSASSYGRPSQSSAQSSPERSRSRSRRPPVPKADFASFDNLMNDLQSLSRQDTSMAPPPPPPASDKPMSLRTRRQPPLPSKDNNAFDPAVQDLARSRSRSRSRPPPTWDSFRRDEPEMPQRGRDYSPERPRTSGWGASSERRTRSRSRGRQPGPMASRGVCKACGDPISGKSISSADGQLTGRYHKACFVCTTCSEPFASSTFYVYDDKPYCERHYHEKNGSLCGSCGDGIEGQYLADESDKKYHTECFTCNDCDQVLSDGYFEVNGKAYCEKDAYRRMQQPMFSSGPGRASGAPSVGSTLRGLPSTPARGGGFGLPSRPGGFGLPSGNRLGPGLGPLPRPRMEKRMTRLGMM